MALKQWHKLWHMSSAIPWGDPKEGGGDFVKDSVKELYLPLFDGGTEQSKLRTCPSQMDIILNNMKPQ